MEITTPITGLDNYMHVDTELGMKKVIFSQSTKFETISVPNPTGPEAKLFAALKPDFIVRAKSPEGAIDLMSAVWG